MTPRTPTPHRLLLDVARALALTPLLLALIDAAWLLISARPSACGWPAASLITLTLGGALMTLWRRRRAATRAPQTARPAPRIRVRVAAGLLAVATTGVAWPLLRMAAASGASERTPASAIVVFGALVHADGAPSHALRDRMLTGCDLYNAGLAPRLILSGGPGVGPVHETEAMAHIARSCGVPDAAITLDPHGVNTLATVRNVAHIASRDGLDAVLVVSHGYHLPRIEMTSRRVGLATHLVAAEEPRMLRKLPYFMLREVAAYWFYFLRPIPPS